MSQNPYCILPWIHVTSHTDGRTSPCCTWKGPPSTLTALEYFNSAEQHALRESMLRHDPLPSCIDCRDQQILGTHSPRDDGWNIYKQLIKHSSFDPIPNLEFIEISFSNICNLKCKMCGGDRSTKWASDSEAMGFPLFGKLVNNVNISDAMLQTLRFIRVLGGEPLLHEDQLIEILTRALQLGKISQLTIGITTNGMIMPSDELVRLLQRCQNTFWTISVDAFGDLNDYIRSGSDWHTVSTTIHELQRLSEQIGTWSIDLGSVCMLYNINLMPALTDWLDDAIPALRNRHNWFPLHFPEYLAIDRLPSDYLHELADRYENMITSHPSSNNAWRADNWWRPLSIYLKNAAAKTPYFPEGRSATDDPFKGDSRYLIHKLDSLRNDDLELVNPEIHYQLHRNAK